MYKGIYWPSLTNSFQSKHLELAYLRYSHRQRQKALIIVNIVDLLLKVTPPHGSSQSTRTIFRLL
jgi:adenylate cyclase 8